jgi:hypothetical protein
MHSDVRGGENSSPDLTPEFHIFPFDSRKPRDMLSASHIFYLREHKERL